MKKTVFSAVLLIVAIFSVKSASAYGGGGGFPPGYYDNPHPRPGLVCEWVTKELPNGKKITVPRCRVVRNTESKLSKSFGKNKNISHRMKDFLNRLKFGRS